MPSEKRLALVNLEKFQSWVDERYAAGDWHSYILGGQLNRTVISRECMFASSVLRQNPAVKDALDSLEKHLGETMILTADIKSAADKASDKRAALSSTHDRNRIKALEELSAVQKAKIQTLEVLFI